MSPRVPQKCLTGHPLEGSEGRNGTYDTPIELMAERDIRHPIELMAVYVPDSSVWLKRQAESWKDG